jgi:hypothetical protein
LEVFCDALRPGSSRDKRNGDRARRRPRHA